MKNNSALVTLSGVTASRSGSVAVLTDDSGVAGARELTADPILTPAMLAAMKMAIETLTRNGKAPTIVEVRVPVVQKIAPFAQKGPQERFPGRGRGTDANSGLKKALKPIPAGKDEPLPWEIDDDRKPF
jgi:hypothetical protein